MFGGHLAFADGALATRVEVAARRDVVVDLILELDEARRGDDVGEEEVCKKEMGRIVWDARYVQRCVGAQAKVGKEIRPGTAGSVDVLVVTCQWMVVHTC